MEPITIVEEVSATAQLVNDESALVGHVGKALSQLFPGCLVKSYTLSGFPARGLAVSRHFHNAAEIPDAPSCRGAFRELFLPLVRRAAREHRTWVEFVGDGLLSADELERRLARNTALRALAIAEWGLFVATLGTEPVGGANVLVPVGQPGFTAHQRAVVRAVAPRFAEALRAAALIANAAAGLHALEHLLASRLDVALLFSASGHLLGASPAGERFMAGAPHLLDLLGRRARGAGATAATLPLPGLGLQAHLSPCSPRGASAAVLVTLAARAPAAARGRWSARQAELLSLLEEGLSNKEIARQMGLSPTTVKGMLETLYRTAGVSGRVGLLRWRQRPATTAFTALADRAAAGIR